MSGERIRSKPKTLTIQPSSSRPRLEQTRELGLSPVTTHPYLPNSTMTPSQMLMEQQLMMQVQMRGQEQQRLLRARAQPTPANNPNRTSSHQTQHPHSRMGFHVRRPSVTEHQGNQLDIQLVQQQSITHPISRSGQEQLVMMPNPQQRVQIQAQQTMSHQQQNHNAPHSMVHHSRQQRSMPPSQHHQHHQAMHSSQTQSQHALYQQPTSVSATPQQVLPPPPDMTAQSQPQSQSERSNLREDDPFYVFNPLKQDLTAMLGRVYDISQRQNAYWNEKLNELRSRASELEFELKQSSTDRSQLKQSLDAQAATIRDLRGMVMDRDVTIAKLNASVSPTSAGHVDDGKGTTDFVVASAALSTAMAEKDRVAKERDDMGQRLNAAIQENAALVRDLTACREEASRAEAYYKGQVDVMIQTWHPVTERSNASPERSHRVDLNQGTISTNPDSKAQHYMGHDAELHDDLRHPHGSGEVERCNTLIEEIRAEYVPPAASVSPAPTAAMELDHATSPQIAMNIDLPSWRTLDQDQAPNSARPNAEESAITTSVKEEDVDQLAGEDVDIKPILVDARAISRRVTLPAAPRLGQGPNALGRGLPSSASAIPTRRDTSPTMKRKREISDTESIDMPLSAAVPSSSGPTHPPPVPRSASQPPYQWSSPEASSQKASQPRAAKIRRSERTPPTNLALQMDRQRSESLESGELHANSEDEGGTVPSVRKLKVRLAKIFEQSADGMYRCRRCRMQQANPTTISSWPEAKATKDRFAVLTAHAMQAHQPEWTAIKLSDNEPRWKNSSQLLPQTSGLRY
ncbi:hypothetical protein FRB96_003801 [Tulasnella sp. 330]|nr:hypothetical protein FRB96_003801 [Tulasnella sp. 330]KAG8877353.1 hypothetical protein FRB97_003466 [Tulasnella sp. 331]KAG8882685.1 hypothetical protein FRB98_003543 [Tulasnella sp. 332]